MLKPKLKKQLNLRDYQNRKISKINSFFINKENKRKVMGVKKGKKI